MFLWTQSTVYPLPLYSRPCSHPLSRQTRPLAVETPETTHTHSRQAFTCTDASAHARDRSHCHLLVHLPRSRWVRVVRFEGSIHCPFTAILCTVQAHTHSLGGHDHLAKLRRSHIPTRARPLLALTPAHMLAFALTATYSYIFHALLTLKADTAAGLGRLLGGANLGTATAGGPAPRTRLSQIARQYHDQKDPR